MKKYGEGFLIRYGIAERGTENENPDFDSFECCKEYPLCRYIHESKKFFSRADIEEMSMKLGYSVWDRIGGNDGCQCIWKSFVVTEIK